MLLIMVLAGASTIMAMENVEVSERGTSSIRMALVVELTNFAIYVVVGYERLIESLI